MRQTWGAAFGRLLFFSCLALLFAGGAFCPVAAEEEDEENEAAEPDTARIEPLPRFLSESVVRLERQLSLHAIEEAIDAAFPRKLDSDDWTVYNDSLEIRYAIERDSVVFSLDGYDFKLSCRGHYWLSTRSRNGHDFGETGCGSAAEPIGITFGYRGRIGWEEDWRLGYRLEPEADVFAFRCKPKPPAHNFTRFLERQVQQGFHRPMGASFIKEMAGFDDVRAQVDAAWTALSQTIDIHEGEVWMDWNPVRIEADPAGGQDENLDIRLSIVAEPAFRVGGNPGSNVSPLPAPIVRVAGDEVRIPVEVSLAYDAISEHVLNRLHAPGASAALKAVGALRFHGEGDRLEMEILPAGKESGGAVLEGRVAFRPDSAVVEVEGLEYTSGSADRLAADFPGLDPETFRIRMTREMSFNIHDELAARRQLVPSAINRAYGTAVVTHGAMTRFAPEPPLADDSRLLIRHWATGPVWITIQAE